MNNPGHGTFIHIITYHSAQGQTPLTLVAPVYVDGEKNVTLKGEHIAEEFQQIVETYVSEHYAMNKSVTH